MPKPASESSYDVFISYSQDDADWVRAWLLPRLKAADLKVCTDREAFDVGVPRLVNIENAVTASRHTVLVLTKAWVGSRWAQYETLLAQTDDPDSHFRRLLPVLRGPCDPPKRIAMLTYADLTGHGDTEAEFARLLDAIRDVRRLADAGATHRTLGMHRDLAQTGWAAEAADAELSYRDELIRDLTWHDFRGIYQFKQNIRLPLADIYQELGFLKVGGAAEHRQAREKLLTLDDAARAAETERRMDDRVSDALARAQKLVILGDPGAGKTITLKYIALMLASGRGGERLGLAAPYLPVRVRLAYFAQELMQKPALSLDNWLLQIVPQQQASHPRLCDFVRLTLQRGAGVILLDGLDEVGNDPVNGQTLRKTVVARVRQFADRWCTADRPNRLIVTSRIEGYWDEALSNCDHVELSPLSPPDEVEQFLLRWYGAYERDRDSALTPEIVLARATGRVSGLLPQLLETPSVKRLAANPLLLTILVLIYENVGKLPNRRAKLYDTCTKTLLESWRQEQTERQSKLLDELGDEGEQIVTRVVAALAYWLHERYPGGAAPLAECREQLRTILTQDEGYAQRQAEAIAESLLDYASCEAGLLCERGLGRYGFFHLTFEEYLAAYHLARRDLRKRAEMLAAHWEDERWREVLLLAAGVLGVVDGHQSDASVYVTSLRQLEPADPANLGRGVVLAGRALADIGQRNVNPITRRDVMRDLRLTMQDRDLETERPHDPARVEPRTRYAAGEAWDELGGLPDDLDAWVLCPKCADPSTGSGRDLLVAKYPVTNLQFERFIQAGGYENWDYWGGKDSPAWRWRMTEHGNYRGKDPVTQPEYWHTPRFGKDRRGYPVVGVSWYEAAAYARWLMDWLKVEGSRLPVWRNGQLVAWNLQPGTLNPRLPTDAEWLRQAGGEKEGKKERYPWDAPGSGRVTESADAILARANTTESGLGGTSPVAMYPLGASRPFGLWDVAGNVWEWTDTWYDADKTARVVRGGSWCNSQWSARPSVRYRYDPVNSSDLIGFRLVSPISSGC
jgi:formylglycine-generating enzyme required for sulfatase activity